MRIHGKEIDYECERSGGSISSSDHDVETDGEVFKNQQACGGWTERTWHP